MHPETEIAPGATLRLRRPRFLLPVLLLLVGRAAAAQQFGRVPPDDRARAAEAFRLGDLLRERIWPGWGEVQVPLLLVTDSVEYLLGHPRPAGFLALDDTVAGRAVWARARVLPATLLATFPLAGVPTAVVGTADRTGKRSPAWVLSVLHEQFHQWQYSRPGYYGRVAALGLAGGDSTGAWMLDYPFPYERPAVGAALRRLGVALIAGSGVSAARRALVPLLTPPEERYLEFQIWQEGVARYVELVAARAAASAPPPNPEFRALPDFESYARLAETLERNLTDGLRALAPARQGRLVFYPLGAGIAGYLDRRAPGWRRGYVDGPLGLDHLLEAPAAP